MKIFRLLVVGACLTLAGCRTVSDTEVKMNRAGSGTISVSAKLDKAAAAGLPADPDFFGLSELRKAGWSVRGPVKEKDGSQLVSASHEFEKPAQAQALLRQVAPPFSNLTVSFSRGLFSSKAYLRGEVDLTKGIGAFVPSAQQEIVIGTDPAVIEKLAGGPVNEAASISLSLNVGGSKRQISLPLGKSTSVDFSSRSFSPTPWWLLLAAAFVALALAMIKKDQTHPSHLSPPVGRYGMGAR